jgi:DNA-binding CsgD family transcriptional regulator
MVARPVLADAVQRADTIGARWLARRGKEELAVAGGRRRRRRMDVDELSPQERRVARLAVAGLSSAEIAGELSVSVNTIHTHLRRIYAKWEVHSRRELMAMGADIEIPGR